MSRSIDPAILKALSLDASKTTISNYGGGGFSTTSKLTSTIKGEEKAFFIKTKKGTDSEVMFAGEHASLNAINSIIPSFCPISHAHGALIDTPGSFLATSFLTLSRGSSKKPPSGLSFAAKLAKLHSTPTPIPEGHFRPVFGFPVPTCCGDTQQDNSYIESWAEFYAQNRLLHVLHTAEGRHGSDAQLARLVHATSSQVVPRLLGDDHLRASGGGGPIVPVVVHGDLWSGNHGRDEFGEEVVYDPSSSWSHSEFEFGIVRMFGGGVDEKEYFELKVKDEPIEEFEDRVSLYELYHHLNHYSIFGGSYKGGAMRIMERLLAKYGDGG